MIKPLIGCVAASFVVTAFAQGPVQRPEWFVGESWTYEAKDEVKQTTARLTYEVTKKTDTGYAMRFTRVEEGGPPRVTTGTRSLDLNRLRKVGGVESDSGWFRFPLQLEAPPWKAKELWSDGNGYDEHTYKVVGWEKVAVPAGTFEVFRIESDSWWTDTSMRWGPRPVSNRSEWRILYAPDLKMWAEIRLRVWNWQGAQSVNVTEKLVAATLMVDGQLKPIGNSVAAPPEKK